MCDRCSLTQNFDPVRHKGEPFGAQYQESLDAASGVSTSYTIQGGDIFRGNIQSGTDEDWVRLTLSPGERYELLLEGQDGGGGTLPDPILTLRDASGNLISTNDDFTNRDSGLSFTADSATYYAQASAFGGGVGSYRLTLNQTSAPDLDEDFVDAAAGITTFYTIDVGETFTGDISSGVDEDWVRVILTEGQSYTIGVSGVDGGGGTLSDPYLKVYDATSTLQGSDDDGGGGFDSQLTFTAGSSGFYYIAASGVGGGIGTYTISIMESNAPEPDPGDPGTGEGGVASYDQLARYLTEGYWEDDGRSARSFSTSFDNVITVDITGLNADGRQLARWAFEAWEMVADIEFSEVSFGADIDFNDWDSGAYATSSVSGTRILSSDVNVDTQWLRDFGTTIDSYSFSTYIHEIGHALGLGHQGDYNGNATYGFDETFTNDSWQVSIMSYFSQSENTTVDASEAGQISTMMADIIAIQSLYGAPDATSSATAGNTVWGANTTLGGYWRDYFTEIAGGANSATYQGQAVSFTVYDVGGTDLVDLSFSTANDRLDMRAEAFSDVGGLRGNVAVARGTVLENLRSGSGNDTITGNAADNEIRSGDGADEVAAGAGLDTLQGGGGNDTLNGDAGADDIDGGDGADSLTGGDGADTVNGGGGVDEIYGNSGLDRLHGGAGDDYISGGFSRDELHGDDGRDELQGRTGADTLYGGTGNDTLYGSQGQDMLFGGANNDLMYGATASDTLEGGGGNDTMFGSEGTDSLRGGDGRDEMSGGSGSDTLYGDGGNDEVRGNAGSDRISGGAGNDSIFGGTGSDQLDGDEGDDLVAGQNGGDLLRGSAGDDTLRGGAGDDTLDGGNGSDTFVFDAGFEMDVVEDFDTFIEPDRLSFSTALTGGLTDGAAIAAAFGNDDTGTDVVFDFGGGNQVILQAVISLDDLAGLIDTF